MAGQPVVLERFEAGEVLCKVLCHHCCLPHSAGSNGSCAAQALLQAILPRAHGWSVHLAHAWLQVGCAQDAVPAGLAGEVLEGAPDELLAKRG